MKTLILLIVPTFLISCQSSAPVASRTMPAKVMYSSYSIKPHADPPGVHTPLKTRENENLSVGMKAMRGAARTLSVTGRVAVGGMFLAAVPFSGASPDQVGDAFSRLIDEPLP